MIHNISFYEWTLTLMKAPIRTWWSSAIEPETEEVAVMSWSMRAQQTLSMERAAHFSESPVLICVLHLPDAFASYLINTCVCAMLLQSCLTLCDPTDCSLPGSSVHGILQARILEWAAMPSSRGSSQPRDQTCISYVSCTGRWVLYH